MDIRWHQLEQLSELVNEFTELRLLDVWIIDKNIGPEALVVFGGHEASDPELTRPDFVAQRPIGLLTKTSICPDIRHVCEHSPNNEVNAVLGTINTQRTPFVQKRC